MTNDITLESIRAARAKMGEVGQPIHVYVTADNCLLREWVATQEPDEYADFLWRAIEIVDFLLDRLAGVEAENTRLHNKYDWQEKDDE